MNMRNYLCYLFLSVASFLFTYWASSEIVDKYLANNLVTIVIALLAINVQTIAVMAAKLKEITKDGTFKSTVKEIRVSIREQCLLVIASLFICGAHSMGSFEYKAIIIGICSFFVIYASLFIFIDTFNALITALFSE